MQRIFALTSGVVAVTLLVMCPASQAGDLVDAVVTKNRERFQKNSDVYKDKTYRYCDDKEIQGEIQKTRQKGSNQFDLCSERVDKNSDVKKVVTVVDTRKDIKINSMPGKVSEPTKVNLGTVEYQGGGVMRNKELKSVVRAKDIEVK
ncbi:MAG: hypothetical protein HQL63_05015 [Magnetococcales bacterium]|nr:hypothetical protein [Magnetococcales bacterium]MBF0322257.1 hypothetical protein [Magnetococcales bacterium]